MKDTSQNMVYLSAAHNEELIDKYIGASINPQTNKRSRKWVENRTLD